MDGNYEYDKSYTVVLFCNLGIDRNTEYFLGLLWLMSAWVSICQSPFVYSIVIDTLLFTAQLLSEV